MSIATVKELAVKPQKPGVDSQEAERRRLKKIVDQFEAIFIAKLLKSMRPSDESGLFGKGLGAETYQSLFESSLAERIASTGQIGISDLLLKSLFEEEKPRPSDRLTLNFSFPAKLSSRPAGGPFHERVKRFDEIITSASSQFKIPKNLLLAVIKTESDGDPFAVSKAGAKGLMQLMDETAAELGVRNSFDPRENILAGTRYLKQQLQTFDGNLEMALAAYNAGPSSVFKYNGIPPFRETQNYVRKVIASANEIKNQLEI